LEKIISLKKYQILKKFWNFENIKFGKKSIFSKLSIFSKYIPIFIDLLSVLQFLCVDKTDVTNIYLESHFELLLQIIDGLVVFSRPIIYFKVVGISFYFIRTMKLAPNSNFFVFLICVEIKAPCHNSQVFS
jgi:hypothetical protein